MGNKKGKKIAERHAGRVPPTEINPDMTVRRDLNFLAACVAVLTFLVYLPALRNNFVNWDDYNYVLGNIRSLNWAFFRWAFTDTTAAGYWHPFAWISHAVDYAIWGLNPLGHHLTSCILHAVNTFIVVRLTVGLLEVANRNRRGAGEKNTLNGGALLLCGGLTGILFGIHPLHVESVAWVAERKDLLFTLFYLLGIMSYMRYAGNAANAAVKRNFCLDVHYMLSVVFCALALCSKPMAVTLPVVLMVLDWYPFGRFIRKQNLAMLFAEKLPFIALSFIVTIVTFMAQKTAGAMELMDSVPLPARILVAVRALVMYLWKMIAPVDLLPLYPYPQNISLIMPAYLLPALIVSGVTAACMLNAKKRPLWLAVWAFYVISLFPVLGIIQVGSQPLADRFIYLPSIGPFLLIGLGSGRGWMKARALNMQDRPVSAVAIVVVLFLTLSLSYLTVQQISVWNNSIRLWNYVIERAPFPSSMAYNSRGLSFARMGDFDHALGDYNTAISLEPAQAPYYVNRGVAFSEKGDLVRALADLDKAITLKHTEYMAYNNRGNIYFRNGELDRALEDFNKAVALKPSGYLAYNNRGNVFLKKGELDQAIENFSSAIRWKPDYDDAYYNRGVVFRDKGMFDLALADFTTVISLSPEYVEAYLYRGDLFQKQGNKERAVRDYQKSCELGSRSGCDVLHSLTGR